MGVDTLYHVAGFVSKLTVFFHWRTSPLKRYLGVSERTVLPHSEGFG